MPAESALRDGPAAGFELIETLRWEPVAGFIRLDRHLARLANSARDLGFAHDEAAAREMLEACSRGETPLRVRLTLAQDGSLGLTSAPFEPLPGDAAWTLRIAKTRLDPAYPLLRHKTTWRQVYEAARAEFSRGDADEVLLMNERGEICEGTITNVFVDTGEPVLLTPALTSGLLPGVLRGELLDEGKAREAVINVRDLKEAKAVFVGNSLRGLVHATLVT